MKAGWGIDSPVGTAIVHRVVREDVIEKVPFNQTPI